jgi:chromate transport protein ChrA
VHLAARKGHIAIMLREFVQKRNYITEEELMELNALAQVLPGPSSTQTLVGIAWKVGGLMAGYSYLFAMDIAIGRHYVYGGYKL